MYSPPSRDLSAAEFLLPRDLLCIKYNNLSGEILHTLEYRISIGDRQIDTN